MLLDKCPYCGSFLCLEYDGYDDYYTCIVCARQWDLDGKSRRMTPKELEKREGIHLTHGSDFL